MPANTLSPEAQKLVDVLGELAETNRRIKANIASIRRSNTIYDMVAGLQPCAPVAPTETQCIACEGVPSRKCPDCPGSLCADCWPDHNHGER
jgi:hypothetical protein